MPAFSANACKKVRPQRLRLRGLPIIPPALKIQRRISRLPRNPTDQGHSDFFMTRISLGRRSRKQHAAHQAAEKTNSQQHPSNCPERACVQPVVPPPIPGTAPSPEFSNFATFPMGVCQMGKLCYMSRPLRSGFLRIPVFSPLHARFPLPQSRHEYPHPQYRHYRPR